MLTELDAGQIWTVLSTQTIVKRGIRKLYYVTNGRNAWRSTWVNQYRSGCMHLDFSEAAKYAERLRTNGSVFKIEEIPSLIIEGTGITLVVTQINCEVVLKDYVPSGINTKSSTNNRNVLAPKSSLSVSASTFNGHQAFWSICPPLHNSVLMFTTNARLSKFEKYEEADIAKYRSRTQGAQFILAWDKIPGAPKDSALKKILATR